MDATAAPAAPTPEDEKRDIEENKDIAAFGYLWVMSVVVYFLRRHSPFVRFHAKQAMVLFLVSLVVWFIPFVNRPLELLLLACMAYGFLNAAQGQKKDVPIVGPLSRNEITLRQAWQQVVALVVRFAKALKDLAKTEPKKQETPFPAPDAQPTQPAPSEPSAPEPPAVPPSIPPQS